MSVAGLRGRLFAAIGLLAIASGCGGGGDGGSNTGTNPGTMSISLGASTLSLTQGTSGNVTVTVARGGSFTGDVSLSVTGMPTGVTVANATIPAGQTAAALSINTAATAAVGNATLVVQASGAGVTTSSASLALTVNAAQAPAGSITLTPTPANVTVEQGGTAAVTVTINRTNFTGPVNLSVAGNPAGVTATLSSTSVTGNTATLTIDAAAAAAAGNSTISIIGGGTGISTVTATVTLTVTATIAGSFALSATPATVSVAQGAAGNVTLNIARTNFAGAVNLVVTGAPAGVTPALSSSSVTGNSATLTLTVGAAAAVGNSTITVTGTGTGAPNSVATVTLSVTGGQVGAGNTTLRFCGETGIPLWVASQNGTAAWQRVTGANDTYSFDITGRGGIAYVVPAAGGGFDLALIYGTSVELGQISTNLCNGVAGAGKSVTAAISGAAPADIVLTSLGPIQGVQTGNTSATFTGVPNGNVDLVAGRSTFAFNGASVSVALQKMIIRRNLSPAAGSALAAIDFGTEGFTPVTRALTINNLNGELSTIVGTYLTANNYAVGAYYFDINPAGGSRTYAGVPTANQVNGDLHLITVSAVPSLQNTTQTRNVIGVFKDATDKTLTLGPAMTAPTITTLAATGYGRLRASIPLQAEYNRHLVFDAQGGTGAAFRRTYIQVTSGYHDNASPVIIDIPDFSGVAGFDVNWGLRVGTQATWTVTGTGWTGGTAGQPPYADGAVYLSGTRMGSVTP